MGVALTSLLIDYCISGLNVKKYVMIIPSDKERAQAINAYILEHLERGATVYRAEGAYSKAEKCVLTTVMDRREFVVLKQFIHQVDENAFVTVQNLHDVFGEGFHKE
jgi:uncharacterized membrane-anchored protein YitT (DUF2179 family)